MAHLKDIEKVKLICGIMYTDSNIFFEIKDILESKFGNIDFVSPEYGFNFTNYYEEELGKNIKKRIISFQNLIGRENLAEIKTETNNIEDEFSEKNNRKINLDPGYLTKHNVVLASAKEMPHKVYIGKGLFGDPVLEYRNHGYQDFGRTFPDYKTDLVKNILIEIRKIYLEQLKQK